RHSEGRDDTDDVIRPAVVVKRAEHAEQDPEHGGQQHRVTGQLQGDGHALGQQALDRQTLVYRIAEVSPYRPGQPAQVTNRRWLIETVLPQASLALLGGALHVDERRRPARGEVDEREGDERDQEQHQDPLRQPVGDVAGHLRGDVPLLGMLESGRSVDRRHAFDVVAHHADDVRVPEVEVGQLDGQELLELEVGGLLILGREGAAARGKQSVELFAAVVGDVVTGVSSATGEVRRDVGRRRHAPPGGAGFVVALEDHALDVGVPLDGFEFGLYSDVGPELLDEQRGGRQFGVGGCRHVYD